MINVLILIRSLDHGGTQRQLIELVKGLDKTRFAITIMTFYEGGGLQFEIAGIAGVTRVSLRKQGRWDVVPFLWRLTNVVRNVQPQIVHGYAWVANELALGVGKAIGAKVVWGLRASNIDFARYNWLSSWSFRISAWLSRFADMIVVNSYAGRQYHLAHGYNGGRMVVIHNGIDTERFRADREAGGRVRREWGIAAHERLIGLVGRLDPMKDHPTFLRAAALLVRERSDLRFVCVGEGSEPYKRELQSLAQELGLGTRLIWAGARDDMPAVYNALDVATSSSAFGEGFSNVIGEAMACGVPCVVTDVGDSAVIVGDSGQVVPPVHPEALLNGWTRIVDLPAEGWAALSQAARDRIVRRYSAQQLLDTTEAALTDLVSQSDGMVDNIPGG